MIPNKYLKEQKTQKIILQAMSYSIQENVRQFFSGEIESLSFDICCFLVLWLFPPKMKWCFSGMYKLRRACDNKSQVVLMREQKSCDFSATLLTSNNTPETCCSFEDFPQENRMCQKWKIQIETKKIKKSRLLHFFFSTP